MSEYGQGSQPGRVVRSGAGGVAFGSISVALLSLAELIAPVRAEDPAPVTTSIKVINLSDHTLPERIIAEGAEGREEKVLSLNPDSRPIRPRLFFGGGAPPQEALELFLGWSGGQEARIVAIGWGSTVPQEYFDDFNRALLRAGGPAAIKMPELDELGEEMEGAISVMRDATGVFLMGGDQVRLMRALHATKLGAYLRERLEEDSLVIAGTSAGTAVGSDMMIGGSGTAPSDLLEYVPVERSNSFMVKGLGIVPADVILEQHCLRPGRLLRLEAALEAIETARTGVGIEDGGCIAMTDDLILHAIGPTKVHVMQKGKDGTITCIKVLEHGDTYDSCSYYASALKDEE